MFTGNSWNTRLKLAATLVVNEYLNILSGYIF